MAEKYTEQILRDAIAKSESYAEMVRILGAGKSGSTVQHLKIKIKKLGIDTSHFTHRNRVTENAKKPKSKDILVKKPEGSSRTPRRQLIFAMFEQGIEYKCALCPLTNEWNGHILNLEIDHINGNGVDNRIENLRFLCPNCHSQTITNTKSKAYNPMANDNLTKTAVVKRKQEIKERKIDVCPACSGPKYKYAKQCKGCVDLTKNLPSVTKKHFAIKDEQLEEILDSVRNTSYRATSRKYKKAAATIKSFLVRNQIDPVTLQKIG